MSDAARAGRYSRAGDERNSAMSGLEPHMQNDSGANGN